MELRTKADKGRVYEISSFVGVLYERLLSMLDCQGIGVQNPCNSRDV